MLRDAELWGRRSPSLQALLGEVKNLIELELLTEFRHGVEDSDYFRRSFFLLFLKPRTSTR